MSNQRNLRKKQCGQCKKQVQSKHWSRHWQIKDHEGITPYEAGQTPVMMKPIENENDDMADFSQQPILTAEQRNFCE